MGVKDLYIYTQVSFVLARCDGRSLDENSASIRIYKDNTLFFYILCSLMGDLGHNQTYLEEKYAALLFTGREVPIRVT